MQTPNALQIWISQLDRRWYAALIGLLLGLVGGSVALLLVVAGPTLTIAAVLGVLVALYILTDVNIALYGAVGTLLLLPFGTFPVDIGLTPTLLDMALGAFVLVYLFEWMTGKRQRLSLTPIHALIALYTMWLILAFMLGLRYGNPTSTIIRNSLKCS